MSWEPINLANIGERPATSPSIGGVNLVYPGKRHYFSGPPESAKTLAAYAIALDEVHLGGNVLLIDFEMGQWDARDRMKEMGATATDFDHVFYVEPEIPASEEIVKNMVSTWAFSLVVIDAAAGAYNLQGLDDNRRDDVEAFTRIYVRSFWLHDVATVVLDHVPKNTERRGRFAIGSERKVGGADVHLGFEVVTPIRRGGRGLYKIVTHKDRFGHLDRPKAAELELRSDPDTHAITWEFRHEPTGATHPWQPTHLMERISRWLEEQPDAVSRNEVERNVTGTAKYVRHAVDVLISEGYVLETTGRRGSRPVRSVSPYREATASECVATASDAVPARSAKTASARRAPYGADAVDAQPRSDVARNRRPSWPTTAALDSEAAILADCEALVTQGFAEQIAFEDSAFGQTARPPIHDGEPQPA